MPIYSQGRPMKYNPTTGAGIRPPAAPGEYRLRSAQGTLLYIGETDSLSRRMGEHVRSGKLPPYGTIEYQIADGRSTSRTRREHERLKIARHRPVLNRSQGGEGRPARK